MIIIIITVIIIIIPWAYAQYIIIFVVLQRFIHSFSVISFSNIRGTPETILASQRQGYSTVDSSHNLDFSINMVDDFLEAQRCLTVIVGFC